MNTQRELFFKNLKTFGLGLTNWAEKVGAFWVFSAKVQYQSCHCESLVHVFEYLVDFFYKNIF